MGFVLLLAAGVVESAPATDESEAILRYELKSIEFALFKGCTAPGRKPVTDIERRHDDSSAVCKNRPIVKLFVIVMVCDA
jgi:hypothetical protein